MKAIGWSLLAGTVWQITRESRWLLDELLSALDDLGIDDKNAASLQGELSVSQWNHQIHGRSGTHPSLLRVGLLTLQRRDVLELWLKKVAARVKGQFISEEDFLRREAQMRSLIDAVQVLVLQLQASEQRRPMLKADLVNAEQKERVS